MRIFVMLVLMPLMLVFSFPLQGAAQQRIPILIYHSIDEFKGSGSKELYVTPENFEKQMKYLKDNGYTLLTFERWKEIDKVNKPIFITLDDGYKNNLNVLKVFQKLQDRTFQPAATLFIISDFVGRSTRLSKIELKNLAESGFFSIQSHTATHPDLTKITNYEYELKQSKEKIEKMIGKPVIALAYPYGNFNDQVVAETKKYYQFGLTTTPGPYEKQGAKNERYLLPRIYVKYSTTMKEFKESVQSNERNR
ncbi:polysaccharide deacetylase family protein [Priestia abyssalis]|uniref:polysaccharide deacetylase family protein n=1 Tax=Priestia abyssalis TaxID=1221450 RepID=UPI000994B9A4|nr:polysaccharide deacetylase family protein [Priestia abyssalis]